MVLYGIVLFSFLTQNIPEPGYGDITICQKFSVFNYLYYEAICQALTSHQPPRTWNCL